ncbi:MAG TPA: hypothetical protein VKY70_05265, partial [Pseudomonas sp.]|nr:hypothetical protein [Pseudomonas sp.]
HSLDSYKNLHGFLIVFPVESGVASDLARVACRPEPAVDPYGDRKTARILTATPYPVNTGNRPFGRLERRVYQALTPFKQTFVLSCE